MAEAGLLTAGPLVHTTKEENAMVTTTGVAAQTAATCWRGVLVAGGSTAFPRWTRSPVPGTGSAQRGASTLRPAATRSYRVSASIR